MPYRTAVPHPQPSLQDRPPSKPAPPTYHEAGRLSRTRVDERHQPISDREAERLAEKIVSVGGSWSLAGWLLLHGLLPVCRCTALLVCFKQSCTHYLASVPALQTALTLCRPLTCTHCCALPAAPPGCGRC